MKTMHEWRKRAKDVCCDLLLVEVRWPEPARKLARDAKNLSALLGDERNLAMLGRTLARRAIGTEKSAAMKLIASQRLKLQRKAFKLGAKFFAKEPRAFFRRKICKRKISSQPSPVSCLNSAQRHATEQKTNGPFKNATRKNSPGEMADVIHQQPTRKERLKAEG